MSAHERDRSEDDDRRVLMRVLLQRDPVALAVLYEKFRESLAWHLVHHVDFTGDVMDLVQEVFVCLWQGRCSYDNKSDARTYLMGIARNLARKRWRRERRRSEIHSSLWLVMGIADSNGDAPRGGHGDPQKASQDRETRDKILTVLRRLPQKSREALELVYLDGIRPYEAARRLGCPFPVFRNRMRYGLARLRQEFETVETREGDL